MLDKVIKATKYEEYFTVNSVFDYFDDYGVEISVEHNKTERNATLISNKFLQLLQNKLPNKSINNVMNNNYLTIIIHFNFYEK